ncbi:hypothetical protein V8C40DRAFT_277780 [Trichoderma camerunense]
MASTRQLVIPTKLPENGPFHVSNLTQESADKLAQLLISNHDKYHLSYHQFGLHNHILHHLLCIYALGATPLQMEKAFDLNAVYQLPSHYADSGHAQKLVDPVEFKKCLGDSKYFNDYFLFFRKEIETHGIPTTVNTFIFGDDERAADMFDRFFGGYLHCIIHLGYALEYMQPFLVAEALASTAVHLPELHDFLVPTERVAPSTASASQVEIFEQIRVNAKIRSAMHYDYIDKINDGLIGEAGDELFKIISQWKVSVDEVEIKAVELFNACAYYTTMAQRSNKQIRFDFMLMHTVTTATFLPIYLKTDWIRPESKARLIEWLGRANLLLYAECGAPEPHPEELKFYKPLRPSGWVGVFQRACEYEDDGHTSKFVRGIATVAQMTEQCGKNLSFKLTDQEDFLTIAHMIIDSVENFDKSADHEVHEVRKVSLYPRITEPEVQLVIARWPRYVGFEQGWHHVPDRRELHL